MRDMSFIFVRDSDNFPVGCFAYQEVVGDDGMVQGLDYGYSIFFMNGDKFNRARGREIAQARLEMKPRTIRSIEAPEEMIVRMLRVVPELGIHQWAIDPNTNSPRQLGHRFCAACNRTAKKLSDTIKRKKAA